VAQFKFLKAVITSPTEDNGGGGYVLPAYIGM